MPRAIWTGSISFGLVNVLVLMYSATEEKDLHFNYVHEPDGSRIGYQKFRGGGATGPGREKKR